MPKILDQEFGRLPGEAGSDLTDGVNSKSAGLSKWLHCRRLIIFVCLGRHKASLPRFYLSCADCGGKTKYNSETLLTG